MHIVGGEKAILDALAEAVRIDRLTEIRVRINIILALGGRGEAQLNSVLEIVENLAPGTEARAVALVDHN